jgi:23S rRNA (adenine2503-C2)-methyltransferase
VSAPVVIRRPGHPLPRRATEPLRDLPRSELAAWVDAHGGGPRYRTEQLFRWLHEARVRAFSEMTNLPAAERERLAELAGLPALAVDEVQRALDGTRKLRLRTEDGHAIETVLIPNEGRGLTQCVSSMVGCSLTCRFCATQSMGFIRNLATWEIVDQVYRAMDMLAAEHEGDEFVPRITNVVFMGMGEPLHNFVQVKRALSILTDAMGVALAGRRITVSTAGLVPAIERFGREGLGEEVGLAVSLNATTDEVRDEVMPINTRWKIAQLLDAVRNMPAPSRRRVTFEYVLLRDVNDSDDDAKRLASLVGAMKAQVNVIPFNPHDDAPYERPDATRVARFVARCRRSGLKVHVRRPRGDDIDAACGQLALRKPGPGLGSGPTG